MRSGSNQNLEMRGVRVRLASGPNMAHAAAP